MSATEPSKTAQLHAASGGVGVVISAAVGTEFRLAPRLMTRERMRWYVDIQDTVQFDDGRIHAQPPTIHDDDAYAKKQGLLPLTFSDPATYDAIGEDDRINVLDLPPMPGESVHCQIVKPDGATIDFECSHTFSDEQVEWFRAGSALNIVRRKVAAGE